MRQSVEDPPEQSPHAGSQASHEKADSFLKVLSGQVSVHKPSGVRKLSASHAVHVSADSQVVQLSGQLSQTEEKGSR